MRYPFSKRLIKRTVFVLIALTCTFIIAWMGLRNYVLHTVINSVERKLKAKYKSELVIREDYFTGFARLSLIGITLVPENKDTLLVSDTLVVEPSLTALLTGHVRLNAVSASDIWINLVRQSAKGRTRQGEDSTANYDAFFGSHDDSVNAKTAVRDYAALANKLLRNVFYYLPADLNLAHIAISTNVNGEKELAEVSVLKHGDTIDASLEDRTRQKTWKMVGEMKRNNKTFEWKLYGLNDKEEKPLPFTEAFKETSIYFDTLFLSLDEGKFRSHVLSLSGKMSAKGLMIRHEKIAKDKVYFNQLIYDYHVAVSDHSVIADTINTLQINDVTANAGFSYSNAGHREYGIDFKTGFVPANDFFASLPQGMFNSFDGMKAEGQLQYTFHLLLNTEMPDSLEFESSLKKDKFHIMQYGATNFSMLNGDFIYTAYEHDKPFRTIDISASNPDFIPLQNIPDCFKNAVLTSEDGSFFFHGGFNESAFRKSIVQNYEAGKFVRGGSTISMQLVKNVFLSRRKTVARKAEEALITWLIESNRLVSKERMMEVYLNIIELGPNVYGVNEAAKFYFNKNASQLNLPESIFLASLLPRPKWFKYCFDQNGMLKPYFADYFRVVSNFLLKRNLITQGEYDHLKPEITLQGPAKNIVTPVDSLPPVYEGEE